MHSFTHNLIWQYNELDSRSFPARGTKLSFTDKMIASMKKYFKIKKYYNKNSVRDILN